MDIHARSYITETTTTTTPTTNNRRLSQACPFLVRVPFCDGLWRAAAHGCSRRRDLREAEEGAWWRHEQQSIAMALAAALHHSRDVGPVSHNVLRNQNTAREGTEFYAMSVDSDVVGGRSPSLVDVRSQERLQQRTVEQIVDPVPSVPMLHDAVPHMVEQLVDFFAPLDLRVAEQVIEVPTVSHSPPCAADG